MLPGSKQNTFIISYQMPRMSLVLQQQRLGIPENVQDSQVPGSPPLSSLPAPDMSSKQNILSSLLLQANAENPNGPRPVFPTARFNQGQFPPNTRVPNQQMGMPYGAPGFGQANPHAGQPN